ncbi:MAG: hypothetical protein N3D16_02265 [Anaerolineales bacterium]|nr:hypothetical protein [Anaerolineales bacterium]
MAKSGLESEVKMEYGQILRRAWQITWKYKFLWVFGIAIALCRGQGGGGGGNFNFGSNFSQGGEGNGEFPISPEFLRQVEQFVNSPAFWGLIIGLVVFVLLLTIIAIAIGAFARGALVRSVNRIEDGDELNFRQAWEEGKSSFRPLFALEFLLNLPLLVIGLGFLGVILVLFYNLWQSGVLRGLEPSSEILQQLLAIVPAAVVGFCVLLCVSLIIQLFVTIFTVFGSRAIALEGYGVVASLGRGWQVFWKNLAPSILFALILFGISLVVGIVIGIPIAILAGVFVVMLVGAGMSNFWPFFLLVGVAFAIIITLIASVVGGVFLVFSETVWTLAYRQMVGLEKKPPQELEPPSGAVELSSL